MSKELEKRMRELEERMAMDNREGDLSRARSVTVGTAFGGTSEIMMRGNNGYMWCVLQPVEVVELINQLAANVGLDIDIRPRQDFATWRNWRVLPEERQRLNGHPPFVNDMAPFNRVGMEGMDPELDKLLQEGAQILEFGGGEGGRSPREDRSNKNVMATEKPKNRRNIKRAAKAS